MHHLLDALLNGPAHYTQRHHLSSGMTLLTVIGALVAEFVAAWVIVLLIFKLAQNTRPFIGFVLRHFEVGKQETKPVFLELTFPSDTTKSAYATEQLHILLRHHMASPHIWHRLAAYKLLHSLELYATNDTGIRYIIVVPAEEVDYVEHSLRSYLPGLKIKQTKDYLKLIKGSQAGIVELRLNNDFVLPLKDHKTLEEHDLMAYLTGHMTKLAVDGLIGFQIVVTPLSGRTHHRVMRHIRDIKRCIAQGSEVSSKLAAQRNLGNFYLWLLWYPPLWFISTMMKLVTAVFDILTSMFSKEHELPRFLAPNRDKLKSDNPYTEELNKSIKSKLDQPLFEVSIRVLVASSDTAVIEARLESVIASFQPFATTRQALVDGNGMSIVAKDKHQFERYRSRALTPHFPDQQTIISSSELADLYHFPNTDLTKTEGLVKSRSQELPAPLSIKRSDAKLDVVVGVNTHGGDDQPIGMTAEQRQKHTYVIGKTGTGKTTLLTSAIYQDMVNGKGLAVLDPHGDMFQELLSVVPEHRRQDVVVFDPSDRSFPLGLNLLDPGIEFDDEDEKHDRITSSVISVFMKLADEGQWGPRMEHILRNATMTALQLPNPSLYTLQRLLTEKAYQREVAETLKDPVLKQFWDKEFKLVGSMQLSTVTAPLTNRLGKFITSKRSRHILLQQTSTLRVADVMNEGKILLVNLSKGQIGEDQSAFFGTILTSFIWMAAYQRAEIPEKQRRDFFLYVDEFQNFASPDFSEIVSEGRKYHIALVVSHQSIAQIPDMDLLDSIASNASTLIVLKVGPKDEAFILPYMRPEVLRGDIVNLAPYHFYMKTTSDVSEDAFSGQTVPLDAEMSDKVKGAVIAQSQQQYGTPKATVEAYLETLFLAEEPEDKETQKKSASKKRAASKSRSTKGKSSRKLHRG